MNKLKKLSLYLFTCLLIIGGSVALACAAEAFPSETNAFVADYYVEPINQEKPFFEKILPEIRKNIKENNKHTVTPYYDAFPLANNPENFQGLGSTTYANINGKTVTAEGFFKLMNESLHNPNTGMGLLIYQCIQYKLAHPEEDVKITFSSYRTSVTTSVCVLPESKYYGYARSLFGINYDEHGFVRISYMLTEAARMGIEVTLVNQLPSYGCNHYDPSTGKLKYRNHINYEPFYEQAMKSDCYNKYAPGKKVSDFMKYTRVGWNVEDKGHDMQHLKSCTVSHYLATDGTEHGKTVFFSSSNLDEISGQGRNGHNGTQSGVIISDHDELYRVTYNYTQLMYEYRGKEQIYELRKYMNSENERQMALLKSGRGNEIPSDKQIVYIGTKNDPVFELYFTPFGGGVDSWDTEYNPIAKYVNKLATSKDYIEFSMGMAYYSDSGSNICYTFENVLEKAYCENPNPNNKLTIYAKEYDPRGIADLSLGRQIGYRNIRPSTGSHCKDMIMSYEENGVRHNVSLLSSCNFGAYAYSYRTNSMLVINETEKTGGDFYYIFGKKYSYGMLDNNLAVSPANLVLEAGETFTPKVYCPGKNTLTWSASDKSVATVDKNGKIKALKTGSATITVTDGKYKDTISLKVVKCADCYETDHGLTCNLDEQYVMSKKLKTTPATFEAVFTVEKEGLKSTTALLGSDGMFDPALVFALNKNGQPKVSIRNVAHYSKQYNYTFNKVDVATGERVHLAIVMDFANKQMHCYVNGELAQTLTDIANIKPFEEKHNMVIGGDHRNGNSTYFTGKLESVAVWSDIRTAEEIKKDYSNGLTASDANLLAAYNLKLCDECMKKDLSSNGVDLEHVILWQDKDAVEPVTDFEYSFAVIGDTQAMCQDDPDAMSKVYDWLLENQKSQKIEYVIGLGDITNVSTDKEWTNANNSISKLNGIIPYSLARGNHDDWDDFNRNLHNGFYENTVNGLMNTGNINLSDPVNQPGVVKSTAADGTVTYTTKGKDVPEGGTVKGDLTNSYRYLTVQGTDYLIMTLDFAPNEDVLKWVDKVVSAHPDHKVIITTHAYMYRDGTTIDAGDCYPPSYYSGYTNAQNGDDMWNKCFSKHKNIVMVLSGHDPWQHIVYRQDEGVNGNTVTQMLIDPQYMDSFIGSTGMVAVFYFSDNGEKVTVRYYSVEKDCYGSADSQFTVHLDHTYKTVKTPATPTKDGKIEEKCDCGYVKSTKIIAYPKTTTLSTTEYTYNNKVKTPTVTVKDSNGKALKKDTDYTVSYESGRKSPGRYTVKITFKGDYEGVKRLYFTIKPIATTKITATQTTTTITLKWNKVTGADGYRVYKYNSKTKKYEKLKDVTKTTLKISKLKAGTAYKYKVRAITKDDGSIYGAYSDVFATATKTETPSIKKLSSTKKGVASITWSDVSGESGYQVYYSTKKDSGFKKLDSYKANAVKASKSKLTSGKTYYFKVCAYKKTASGTVYSSWSAVKSIKIK